MSEDGGLMVMACCQCQRVTLRSYEEGDHEYHHMVIVPLERESLA